MLEFEVGLIMLMVVLSLVLMLVFSLSLDGYTLLKVDCHNPIM